VTFQKRRDQRSHKRLFDDPCKGLFYQIRNQFGQEHRVIGRFNRHGQLHGRFGHLYRLLRRIELGPVDNVSPADEFLYRTGIETEFLLRNFRHELSAGLEIGIVKLLRFITRTIALSILRCEKGAQMVVKPPRDLRRR